MKTSCQKVIKKIKQQKWWLEEAPASFFYYDYIMETFVSAEKLVGYPTLKQTLIIIRNNIGMEITPYEEKKKNFLRVFKRELKKPGYFKKLMANWLKIRQELLVLNNIARSKVKDYSKSELIKFAKKFFQKGFNSVIYGAFIECIDPFSEGLTEMLKEKYNLPLEKAQNFASVLAVQPQRSFLTQEKIDFYRLCLNKFSLTTYLEKYHWINTNYLQAADFKPEELKKKVDKEIKIYGHPGIRKEILKTIAKERHLKEQKRKISKRLRLNQEDKILFKLIERFGYYIDLRKESMIRNAYARDKLLLEVKKRTNHSLNDLRAMQNKEIIRILAGRKVRLQQIKLRNKLCAVYYTPKEKKFYYKKEAKEIYQAFVASLKSEQINPALSCDSGRCWIKGIVASAPVGQIKVKISLVINVRKDAFKPGTILVTTMTRPEFMPLVRRAKALITDEGGVICHAAIISRELKIPCIIGTKNATKSLKDGDKVEMDLKTGVVRKI